MYGNVFKHAPYFRLFIPFASGILLECGFGPDTDFSMPVPVLIAGILLAILFLSSTLLSPTLQSSNLLSSVILKSIPGSSFRFRQSHAVLFFMIFLLLGYLHGLRTGIKEYQRVIISGRICMETVPAGQGIRLSLDRLRICSRENQDPGRTGNNESDTGTSWKRIRGRASAFIPDPGTIDVDIFSPGRRILVYADLSGFSPAGNPFQFDYGAFQRGRSVFYSIYAEKAKWTLLPREGSADPLILSRRLRARLLDVLDDHISGREESQILRALLLGFRNGMDPEVRNSFAGSGTLHVLAVSGLHVGIIYFLPFWLFKRTGSRPFVRVILMLLIISGLWTYAFITGLSTSVVRAVIMCSMHGLAVLLRKKADPFHILSLAAFLIVLIRPAALREAGFQLSFIAVTGILLLYKPVRKWLGGFAGLVGSVGRAGPAGPSGPAALIPRRGAELHPGSEKAPGRRLAAGLVQKILDLTAVSICAQIATLPLCLMYFHMIAPVSVLSNLVVIPLVTLLLYAGFLLLLTASLGMPAGLLARFAEFLAGLLYRFTTMVSGTPVSTVEGSILPVQVLLLYLLILLLILLSGRRSPGRLLMLTAAILLCMLTGIVRTWKDGCRQEICIFDIPGRSSVIRIEGRNAWQLSGEVPDPHALPYETEGMYRRFRLEPRDPGDLGNVTWYRRTDSPAMNADLVSCHGINMLILRGWDGTLPHTPSPAGVDMILISGNLRVSVTELKHIFRAGKIICDGGRNYWYARDLEQQCLDAGIGFHDTRRDGCYCF